MPSTISEKNQVKTASKQRKLPLKVILSALVAITLVLIIIFAIPWKLESKENPAPSTLNIKNSEEDIDTDDNISDLGPDQTKSDDQETNKANDVDETIEDNFNLSDESEDESTDTEDSNLRKHPTSEISNSRGAEPFFKNPETPIHLGEEIYQAEKVKLEAGPILTYDPQKSTNKGPSAQAKGKNLSRPELKSQYPVPSVDPAENNVQQISSGATQNNTDGNDKATKANTGENKMEGPKQPSPSINGSENSANPKEAQDSE